MAIAALAMKSPTALGLSEEESIRLSQAIDDQEETTPEFDDESREALEALIKWVEEGEREDNRDRERRRDNDDDDNRNVQSHWGVVETEIQTQIDVVIVKLNSAPGNPARGAAVYEERCAQCHEFNGQGRNVGLDLTRVDKSNLNKFLEKIIDSSDYVRPEYRATEFVVRDEDDFPQYITGFLLRETDTQFIVKNTAAQEITINKDRLEEQFPVIGSIMPEGLLDGLTDTQLRDLFAFLKA